MTIYKASRMTGSDGKHFVNGPGDGLSYDAGTLWPKLRCESEVEAQRAAAIANIAYKEGFNQAKRDIRKVLGLNE